MNVEVVKPESVSASLENKSEESSLLHEKENAGMTHGPGRSLPIQFGSHGTVEPVEVNELSEANFPKDATDEWPAPKQTHYFYFVRYRLYEDQKLKAKVDQADKELQRRNRSRFQITEKLRGKRADRALVIAQLKSLSNENKQFRMIMDEKRKEMEPLQQALGKLRGTIGTPKEKGVSLCSSEEELNYLIRSLQYRIQHESIPLAEEKQLLREIKQLEGTREKVIANAAERAKIQDSLGEKEAIQDQVKLIGVDLDGVRKEQQIVKAKLKQLEEEKEAIDNEIDSLQEELKNVTDKRDKTFENIQCLRKQREEGNAVFYQNRALLSKARILADREGVQAVKKLCDVEVEKFMSLWATSKALRDDYEKRILSSLDNRELSRDGRMRNSDEKPLVEAPVSEEMPIVKDNIKQFKDSIAFAQNDIASLHTVLKENIGKQQKETVDKSTQGTLEQSNLENKDGFSGLEKLQRDAPPKGNEIDEAKLKELRREEEMAKAKQAFERKKKLADKAAAKAALKAQKEAEKKLKERERRAKKKSLASTNLEELTQEAAEVVELEKADENDEVLVPPKNLKALKGKEQNEKSIRHRSRQKDMNARHKVVLKRKKSTSYWIWVVPAVLLLLILVLVSFKYFKTSIFSF